MKLEEIINQNEQVDELYHFVQLLSTMGQIERSAVRFMPLDYHPFVIEAVRDKIKNNLK